MSFEEKIVPARKVFGSGSGRENIYRQLGGDLAWHITDRNTTIAEDDDGNMVLIRLPIVDDPLPEIYRVTLLASSVFGLDYSSFAEQLSVPKDYTKSLAKKSLATITVIESAY